MPYSPDINIYNIILKVLIDERVLMFLNPGGGIYIYVYIYSGQLLA